MAIKTCAQCYIVHIFISICQYFISVLYQYVDLYFFFILLYIEEKHLTTTVKNVLLNRNYSHNTPIFMTYYPEPFHNKYKSDVRLLYGLLLKLELCAFAL